MSKMAQYAFCETATASGSTPWHIRKLTDNGIKLSGGADTPALCGRVVAWDVGVGITGDRLMRASRTCHRCAEEYRRVR